MKVPVAAFAGISVVAAIVAGTMWRELRAERLVNAELRAQLAEAHARPPEVVRVVETRQVPAPSSGVIPAPAAPAAATPPLATPATSNFQVATRTRERDLMRDPEYRKARIAQLRLQLERSNHGLAEALGLSDYELGRFLDLMAESQLDLSAELSALPAPNPQDPAAVQERRARQQALQAQAEGAMRSMLGDAKYALWQDYQQTRIPRQQAEGLGAQLAQAGHPLSPAQSKALATVFIAEHQRQGPAAQNQVRTLTAGDPLARIRAMEEGLRRQEETNRRMLEAFAPSLNSQQLAEIRRQYEDNLAASRASLRVEMARLQAGQPTSVVVAPGAAPVPILTAP